MLTVLEAINRSAQYLSGKGIESPRTNAELLLTQVLGSKRLDLYLNFDRPLTNSEIKKYREFLKRRANNEPLQYIIGKAGFYGLEFKINPSVLIPRPETEILVETVINTANQDDELNILDIGCGCGNISVSLAAHFSKSKILGIDIEDDIINTAKINAFENGVTERVSFEKLDIFQKDIKFNFNFDIIVSNPPYVSKKDYGNLQKEIRNFEPKKAVTDFDDGFTFFKEISKKSNYILKKNGKLFFEMSENQCETVKGIMKNSGLINFIIKKDFLNVDRVICGVLK